MPLSPADKKIARRLAAQTEPPSPPLNHDPRDPFYHIDEYPDDFHAFRMKCFRTMTDLKKVVADFDEVKAARRKASDTRDQGELVRALFMLQARAMGLQKTGKALRFPGLVALGKELLAVADKQSLADRELLKDVLKPKPQ